MANIRIWTGCDEFVILEEGNWECKLFAHFAKTLDSNSRPHHHQYGTQEGYGRKKNSARVLIWQQEYKDMLGDCRFWGGCYQNNRQLYGCVYPRGILQKVMRCLDWQWTMARLTRMIAVAECTSKIISFAIIRCSFGVARVEGGGSKWCLMGKAQRKVPLLMILWSKLVSGS